MHTVAARAAAVAAPAPCHKLKAAAQAPHIACGGPLRWIFLNRYRNDLRLLPNEFAYTNTGGQTGRQTVRQTDGWRDSGTDSGADRQFSFHATLVAVSFLGPFSLAVFTSSRRQLVAINL